MRDAESIIREALRGRLVLELDYDGGGLRVIEPYLLFKGRGGETVLHAWQRSGAYVESPPPDWCNLTVSKIDDVALTEESFGSPHSGYNPWSSRFRGRIIDQV